MIHPLLIYLLSRLYRGVNIQLPEGLDVFVIYCVVTLVTVFVAWVSYKFYESPFLRLKNKFAVVLSRNSMDNN